MLEVPQLRPAEVNEAVMSDHCGPKAWARRSGYVTESRVSNMPPIHSRVLVSAPPASGLDGSKAHRFGGTKWRVPGWEDGD